MKARAGRWIRAVVGKVVGSSQVVRHVAVSGYVTLLLWYQAYILYVGLQLQGAL